MSDGPDKELRQHIVYDDRLESYKTFFNHQWIRDFDPIVVGTPLEEPVFALSVSWRAAANAHVMPWLMMEGMRGLWNSFGKNQTYSSRITAALAQMLPGKVNLRNMARQQLSDAVYEISRQVQAISDSPETDWDVDLCWRTMLNATYEFQVGIWGTQRQCFGSIYYAYEHFMCAVMAKVKGPDPYRMPNYNKFIGDAKTVLPADVVDECISHKIVDAARRVRHALCHNGGKVTKDLSGIKHGVRIEDGFLQLMPDNNRKLIGELEWRAVKLAKTALAVLATNGKLQPAATSMSVDDPAAEVPVPPASV